MKVVHLNTDDSRGGAARAAIRLHQGLLERGAQSSLLVRRRSGLHSHVPGIIAAAENADPAHAALIQEWYINHRRTEVSETIFSGGLAGVSLAHEPAVLEANVLNLHWVAGFLRAADIAELLGLNKRLVWTLHDQWPMTGGCHYSAGCQQFTHYCEDCPQLEADEAALVPAAFHDRCDAYQGRIAVIAPSDWMRKRAVNSSLFHEAPVYTVPNSVDHDVFHPIPQGAAKEKLGIPKEAFTMLFACSAAFEKRKGIPLFRALLKELGGAVFPLFVGWHTAERPDTPGEKHFGFVNDDAALREIYNAADVLVHLASEDNLPNMPLEAMACGTPVLGLNNGGLAEIVDDGVSGVLIPPTDFSALVKSARALAGDRKRCEAYGAAARSIVEQRFTRAIQAERYAAIYEKLTPASSPGQTQGHVEGRLYTLITISAELRLKAAEQRFRDELARQVSDLQQEKQRLERRVRKIERNLGFRIASGLTNGVRNFGRALRGKKSGPSA